MDLGPHSGFIVSAYIIAAVVVRALVVWVSADHMAQKRALADLERRGITRRSAEPRPPTSRSLHDGDGIPDGLETLAAPAPPPAAGITGRNRRLLVLLPLAAFLAWRAVLRAGSAPAIPSRIPSALDRP